MGYLHPAYPCFCDHCRPLHVLFNTQVRICGGTVGNHFSCGWAKAPDRICISSSFPCSAWECNPRKLCFQEPLNPLKGTPPTSEVSYYTISVILMFSDLSENVESRQEPAAIVRPVTSPNFSTTVKGGRNV